MPQSPDKAPGAPAGRDYVKKQTLIISTVVGLALGFLGGVVFTIYKSPPPRSFTAAPQSQGQPRPVPSEGRGDLAAQIPGLIAETARDPNNVTAWIQLGNIYFDTDSHQQAIEAYTRALELDPGNANVWTDMGVMYRRIGQPEKAVECFSQAMANDPKHEISRFNKGLVLLHDLNDMQGAIAAWEDLVALNPVAVTPSGQPLEDLIIGMKQRLSSPSTSQKESP
jgi:cytochrome c-type biogenesis protein CcmH/NrfG